MHAVDMQIERRRGHLSGVERHLLALRRVLRIEEIPDGEAGERVVEMDDQRLARKHLQGRRGVEIVARHLPVRRRAADQLIGEDEHVLDRLRHGIEAGLALLGDQPHLEHAVLAREHDRLAEVGPDRGIEACRSSPSGDRNWRCPGQQQANRHAADAERVPQSNHFAPPRGSLTGSGTQPRLGTRGARRTDIAVTPLLRPPRPPARERAGESTSKGPALQGVGITFYFRSYFGPANSTRAEEKRPGRVAGSRIHRYS